MNKQCVVVFPVYKSINSVECRAFEQAVAMTKGYDQIFVAPQSLVFDETFGSLASLEVARFDDSYFASVEGYNRLMLSVEFYEAFSSYEYILIHQSDAYLFKPELEFWCNSGYDYIGAPWFKPKKLTKTKVYNFLLKYFPFIYSAKARRRHQSYNNVGNGGLSLRKTKTFLNVLSKAPQSLLDIYLSEQHTEFNEDIFWGVEAPKIMRTFKKPDWREALKFSFEEYPEIAFEFNHKQLPFGCHAFNVHGIEFWKEYIPTLKKDS